MRTLLEGIKVLDTHSPFHEQVTNILIQDGKVSYIGADKPEADEVIAVPGLCASPGWFDLNCWVGEPGLEHKEDLVSAGEAAARGGFTRVLVLPDVTPVTQTKNAIAYLQNRSQALPVAFLGAGAVSAEVKGKDLTEMIDLHQAGAVAFTDGDAGIQGGDLLIKALQYAQLFNGLIMQRPQDERLSQHGLMHEGLASVQLGLKGIPALAEEVMVARDLKLLEYAGGRLHFSLISTAGAVAQIREAKAAGLAVTCDIAAFQVAFTDEEILPFDTNYKVNPPFRSRLDQEALIQGLQDGTIDALVSAHRPHDPESKQLEFDLADFGITNLETAFAVANTFLRGKLSTGELVQKFAAGPSRVLQMPDEGIREGALANLTLFDPEKCWTPQVADRASKSENNPFFNREMQGKVFGTFFKNQLVRNPLF